MNKVLIFIIASALVITGCTEYGRYEAGRNHLTGKVCYVFDWKTKERLPATSDNLTLADGDFFWADPEQCHQ